jgi:hypothetical protein
MLRKSRGRGNYELEKCRGMIKLIKSSSKVSDLQLLALMPTLVLAERVSVAEVIEHLVEIDRRRLFLDQACGSLSAYCGERLGYSEDEAGKRVRVTRLASRVAASAQRAPLWSHPSHGPVLAGASPDTGELRGCHE